MSRLNQANPRYLSPFVCCECRLSFKRPYERGIEYRPCPACDQPAVRLDQKYKPPPKSDTAQWEKVRFLIEHGFLFQHVWAEDGEYVPYPDTLDAAKEFVQQCAAQATKPESR